MKRILGLLGWLGVVLVVAALVLRFTRPDLELHPKLALAGLVVTALYTLSQWRDIARSFRVAASSTDRSRPAASCSCSASSSASTGSRRGRTSAGT